MPLNAGIILAGQQPDILGGIKRGNEAAAFQNQSMRTNALADFTKEHGGAVMRGENNALNEYAALAGPEAAMNIQQGRLGMDATRQSMSISAERLQMAKEAAKATAAKEAANVSAAEAAEASAKLKNTWTQLAAVPDEASYNRIATSLGVDPKLAPYADLDINVAQNAGYTEFLDARAAEAPPAPADAYERYRQREIESGRVPLGDLEYQSAIKAAGKSETIINNTIDTGSNPESADKPKKDYARTVDAETGEITDRLIVGTETYNDLKAGSQKTARALDGYAEKNGIVIEDIDRAIDLLENGGIPAAGLANALTGAVPGTPAYRLNELLETVTGNVAFDYLADMRKNSPTGGAVGQLSDSERTAMAAIQGSIKGRNEKGDLLYNLRRLKEVRQNSERRLEEAYQQDFSDFIDATGYQEAPTEKSDADLLKEYGLE